MQHLKVENYNLGNSTNGTKMLNRPLCPKPRRVGSVVPEVLKPLKCGKHSQPKTDERNIVLNMISEKNIDELDFGCAGCSPSCYPGSPPSRTANPLVHDIQFIHQMEGISPFARTKLSDKFATASASPI